MRGLIPGDAITGGVYLLYLKSSGLSQGSNVKTERVITYIDGYNLYYGLRSANWRKYYWLNLVLLSKDLLRPYQNLIEVKYFTARLKAPADRRKRQQTYLEALESLPNLKLFFGKYLLSDFICPKCNQVSQRPSEKMTDVNISVELLSDAFQDQYDTALLISADSDLIGPIERVQNLFPNKKIVVAFPPMRRSFDLSRVAPAFHIRERHLKRNQLPDKVEKLDGFSLLRPQEWR